MNTALLTLILFVVGALTGWLVPVIVGSRRPYGLLGDIGVCVAIMVVLGLIEWLFILPIFDFSDAVNLLAVIGDPIVLALIALWLLRKFKPEAPADSLDVTE